MRVFNSWSKQDWIKGHVPEEFKELAQGLTTAQLEKLGTSIDAYYHRIRRQIENDSIQIPRRAGC